MDALILFLNQEEISYSQPKSEFETTYATQHICNLIVYPKTHKEVAALVAYCLENNRSFHTVSTGLNWGYGGKVPEHNKDVLINLINMKKISVDEINKTATIEPGVTQKELFDFIKSHNYDLMNPITGSSIHSSLVGNAITGGYSNGQDNLRFERILAVKGVFNTGKEFDTFTEQNTKYFDGESVDGKLKGGHSGVVTQMKLILDELPQHFTVLFFATQTEANFIKLTKKLIELKHHNIINTNWCFFNGYRVLAETLLCYPENFDREKALSKEMVFQLLQKTNPHRWNREYNGMVVLYTPNDEIANALKNHIHLSIFPYCDTIDVINLNQSQIKEMRNKGTTAKLQHEDCLTLGRISTFLGIPTRGSVPMSYWRKKVAGKGMLDIEADQCGFVWLAVSISSQAESIAACIKIVEKHSLAHQIEPFYVVDGVKKHETYIMFALVYDLLNESEEQRVKTIYTLASKDLLALGANIYRKPVGYGLEEQALKS